MTDARYEYYVSLFWESVFPPNQLFCAGPNMGNESIPNHYKTSCIEKFRRS